MWFHVINYSNHFKEAEYNTEHIIHEEHSTLLLFYKLTTFNWTLSTVSTQGWTLENDYFMPHHELFQEFSEAEFDIRIPIQARIELSNFSIFFYSLYYF